MSGLRFVLVPCLALVATTAVVGCSGEDQAAGEEPITPEAVAAITMEHLDIDERAVKGSAEDDRVRAEFALGRSYDFLFVTVADIEDHDFACDDSADGCEEMEVDGGRAIVLWQEEEPEEDPGMVVVMFRRDGSDEVVGATYAGDLITGDPREMDLLVDVDEMLEIVQDDRLRLEVSKAVVDLGDDVTFTRTVG